MTSKKQVIILTEAASFQVKEMMLQNEEQNTSLRIAVKGGGCSGLSYGMAFDQEITDKDFTDEQHGIQILVSREDAPILAGTKIDFKQSLMGGGFTIDNPNAIASCGCGTSFRAPQRTGTPGNCE
ncbi:HesB/IscA family protein [Solibacillus sp. FSL H8-0538]|uniref:HesB/IscA family protein n=1 Tax=Solibacillus sp. FSL H8-0538 TaxID=2921400 RepID=UPI0030F9F3E3